MVAEGLSEEEIAALKRLARLDLDDFALSESAGSQE